MEDFSSNSHGVLINNKQYVEVKNCNVQEFEYGIRVTGSSSRFNTIVNNVANSNNAYGFLIVIQQDLILLLIT